MLLGNTQNYNIGFSIYLKDQFSTPVQNVKNALNGLQDEHTAFVNNLKAARAGFAAVGAAGMVATKTMFGWVKAGARYDDMMTVSKIVTRGTADEMERLNALAKSLARETIFFPEDIASGIRFMGMAGQDATTILKTLRAAVNLTATQPGLPLGGKMGGADILTNILKGFDLPAEHSERVADMLAEGSTRANLTVTDMGHSLKYVAATATDLKVPLEDAVAMLMALGNAGIQASMAGTALENMLRYLTMTIGENATARQRNALASMGLSSKDFQDLHGNMIPIVDALGMMRERLQGRGTVEVQNLLKEIFGVRGKRSGSIGVRMLDDIVQFKKMLDQSPGRAQDIMTQRMEALNGVLNIVTSNWENFKVAFTEAVVPVVIPFLKALTWVLEGLQKALATPFGKVVSSLAIVMIPIVSTMLLIKAAAASMILLWKLNTVSIQQMNAAISQGVAHMFKLKSLAAFTPVIGAPMGVLATGGRRAYPSSTHTMTAPGIYRVNATGRMAPQLIRNNLPRINPYSPAYPLMAAGFASSRAGMPAAGALSTIGGVLGKVGAFMMGPWGMAIFLGMSLLPLIISLFKRNNSSQDEIKNLLKPEKESDRISKLFSNKEWYEVIKNKTFDQMLKTLEYIHSQLIQMYGLEKAKEMTEGLTGIEILTQLGPAFNVKSSPVIPINPGSNSMYGK